MSLNRGRVLRATALAAFIALVGCSGGKAPDQPAPTFLVGRLGGGNGSLKDYRGHAVVANVWATWCPPCRHEMPALQRLSKADASRGLIVVGLDQGEEGSVVEKFVRSIGVTYPILLDQEQKYGTAFQVVGLPTSAFIRPNGTVQTVVTGEMSYETMVKRSEQLLQEHPH